MRGGETQLRGLFWEKRPQGIKGEQETLFSFLEKNALEKRQEEGNPGSLRNI